MVLASWGPLGKSLGALLGRLGGLLGLLGAVLGVLGRSFGDSRVLGPSWGHLGALLARLGALLAPKNPREQSQDGPVKPSKTQENPGAAGKFGVRTLKPLKNLQP